MVRVKECTCKNISCYELTHMFYTSYIWWFILLFQREYLLLVLLAVASAGLWRVKRLWVCYWSYCACKYCVVLSFQRRGARWATGVPGVSASLRKELVTRRKRDRTEWRTRRNFLATVRHAQTYTCTCTCTALIKVLVSRSSKHGDDEADEERDLAAAKRVSPRRKLSAFAAQTFAAVHWMRRRWRLL